MTPYVGVQRLFSRELVVNGDIEPEWSKILAQIQDRREDADYDVASETSHDLAKEIVDQARKFRLRIGRFLISDGFDADGTD